MTRDDLRTVVLDVLASVAPDADVKTLDPRADLRDELDLDSMDVLAFVTALEKRLGVTIPESAYRETGTVEGATAYLAARLPA